MNMFCFSESESNTNKMPDDICAKCKRLFNYKKNYDQHVAICAGDRRIKCPYCEKIYTSNSYFRVITS